jgi:hypothetical protein
MGAGFKLLYLATGQLRARMPYLLPRSLTKTKSLGFVLAFGDLSYLEICTVLDERLLKSEQPWSQIAIVEMKDDKGGYEKLAGVHKVVVPVTLQPKSWLASIKELEAFLDEFDDSFKPRRFLPQ